MKNTALIIAGVLILGGILLWYTQPAWLNVLPGRPMQPSGVVCTADAMQCPDGSYVGRTGPNCEFVCPASTVTSTPATSATLTIKLAQAKASLGVTITPTQVVEDSRCPVDVACVWAGRVRVKATVQSGLSPSEHVFEIGAPYTTEAEVITLVSVTPEKNSKTTVEPGQYQFTFKIEKRN